MSEQQQPSIGRIVHYISTGEPDSDIGLTRPAIIVAVGEGERCDLKVFTSTGDYSVQGALPRMAVDDSTPGCWFFPPYVPPKIGKFSENPQFLRQFYR